MVLVMWYFGQ